MIWFHGHFIRAVSMYCSEISAANVLEADPRTFMCPAIGCSPLLWNYAKLYFDTKHLEKGLMRFWNFWSLFFKKSPRWPVANATVIRPWEDEHDWSINYGVFSHHFYLPNIEHPFSSSSSSLGSLLLQLLRSDSSSPNIWIICYVFTQTSCRQIYEPQPHSFSL